jgi:hypothetical protein
VKYIQMLWNIHLSGAVVLLFDFIQGKHKVSLKTRIKTDNTLNMIINHTTMY